MVEGTWSSSSAQGWMGHILGQQLRDVNKELNKWNKEVRRELEGEIKLLVDFLATLDVESESIELSTEEFEEQRTKSSHVWTIPKIQDSGMFQNQDRNGSRKMMLTHKNPCLC